MYTYDGSAKEEDFIYEIAMEINMLAINERYR